MSNTKNISGNQQALAKTLTAIQSETDMRNFLTDLCTPTELCALAERWHIACLLDHRQLSYREIQTQTGVSTTTIARVARFLKDEPYQGYRNALDRLKRQ